MRKLIIFISKNKHLIRDTCRVLLLNPGKGIFDYSIEKKIRVGKLVYVPLKNNYFYGVVIGKGSNSIDFKKLKPAIVLENIPSLSIEILKFCDWLSEWCMQDNSLVARLVVPSLDYLKPIKNKYVLYVNKTNTDGMTKLGLETYKYINENPNLSLADYCKILNISRSVINNLIKNKNILIKEMPFNNLDDDIAVNLKKNTNLNTYQYKALKKLKKLSKKHNNFLIDGVTGSGKTEVYISVIKEQLSKGKQCLILLPEIALTSQLLRTFEERTGIKPLLWHSELSSKDRHLNWLKVLNGNAQVVVGARSALFLPFRNLSCIVVDEEHDSSYKQDDGVIYNARDMAVVRGKFSGAIVILSSATPSLETMNNVKLGKYVKLDLPTRYGNSLMPEIKLIDMRKHGINKKYWISDIAKKAINDAINADEQVLLFLNRRGYSPLTICNSCGHRYECEHCSSSLVYHKKEGKMKCHLCGFSTNIPNKCGECGEENSFIPCGPGVERLSEEVKTIFPNINTEILTSDTLTKQSEENTFNKILSGQVNVIIGTQLVAKGHHFPKLNTVIAIDADLGLSGSDLRASEKTFQLFTQLSGRAGRESQKGKAYIQTFDPENEVMQAILSGNKTKFIKAESKARSYRNLPPYGRLASLIIQSKNHNDLQLFLKLMSKSIPIVKNLRIDVLGPAPAPISKLRDWYRYRYLIKSDFNVRLQPYIKKWLSKLKVNRAIRVKIDIDPYNFM